MEENAVDGGTRGTAAGLSPRELTLTEPCASGENRSAHEGVASLYSMKYLTTLEVAHELKVSKQTLLNWLYGGKVPEPPRNRQGYRLWSPSRVSLVKRLIVDGRLNRRTVVHRDASNEPEVVTELAREVLQFLRDGQIDLKVFVRELQRVARSRVARSAKSAKKTAKKTASPRRPR